MLRNRVPGRRCPTVRAAAIVAETIETIGIIGVVGILALMPLIPVPAQAEVFHVKLRSGSTIDTLYQPQQASWDASVVLLLSDAGNWVGIDQKDVESVQSESQMRGFGIALNFNTIAIGWAPNDAVDPAAVQSNPQAATMQALQNIYQQEQAQSHYTVPQFVSTEQTSGIPASFIGGGRIPQLPAPMAPAIPVTMPAAPPPSGGGAPNG
jgi:hypothetical protein